MGYQQEITAKIIESLEKSIELKEWPWARIGSAPTNAVTGATYSGINWLTLSLVKESAGYPTNEWGTYRQFQSVGAQVKKGAKCSYVYYYGTIEKDLEDGETTKTIPFLKRFPVFNAFHVEGYSSGAITLSESERLEGAECFFKPIPATILAGDQSKACYIPSQDVVIMPPFGSFVCPEQYYSVLAHELGHWTEKEERTGRGEKVRKVFDDVNKRYAFEELVAQLTAAFCCGALGIENDKTRDFDVHYIKNWLSSLKDDSRYILRAASEAQRAFNYLRGFSAEVVEQLVSA